MIRGAIRRVHEITCGLCGAQQLHLYSDRRAAIRHFRALGWHLSGRHGWVCAVCQERGRTIQLAELTGQARPIHHHEYL